MPPPSATTDTDAVFLVNPAAANGSTGRRWPDIRSRASSLGLTGAALFSESAGHMSELARGAAEAGAGLLVVVGGDGTVNEVVNGLDGLAAKPDVAVIPRGTGWDFVRTHGIPRDVDHAVSIALEANVREIDLGRATYRTPGGETAHATFANVASVGMSGAIAQRANRTTKALGGKLSYLIATLAVFSRWRNCEVRVSVDGDRRAGRMHDVIVANGRYFGGGMKICPDASPDDGLLDVLLIGNLTKRDLLFTLPKSYSGRHLPHPKAELLRGRVVEVEADEPLPVELDGEQPGTAPVRFELVPRALRLRVPASEAS